jgi:NAD(P)-dependent dehydrogenase (short-subunit alcohol dehydrogenase family)
MTAFDGMCALVTGAATGLGAATAVAFARGGARVHRQLPVERAGG